MAKFTDDDVAEIVNALRREEGKFAFLTGAGCSLSAGIPSGAKMAADICTEYPHETRRLSDAEKANYALCMACLPIETRKKIINDYLKRPEVKLNWAHIALASLMHGNFVSRVLTFNFDSLLTRACGLLGLYPATYDFGIAPSTKTRHLAKPSIVHLHGQGSGSVLLNTEKETEKHAFELEPLLIDTFANYPMLVMGYSGESDKVFEKIKALYRGDQCLYWLGHTEEPAPHLASFINNIDGSGYCKYIGGADADQFLIQLAQQLKCFPPQVFADPAGHLLAEMKDIAPYPLKEAGTTDILENTVERLKLHKSALLLDLNQTAVLSNNPAAIDTDNKDTPTEIAAWALIKRGDEHFQVARETNSISEYEKAAQHFKMAVIIKPDMQDAIYNWGTVLSHIAFLKQEPALFEESFSKYEAALKIKPDDREALANWGVALTQAWKLTKDVKYLAQATKLLSEAEKLNPDKCYNGACLYAVKNDEEGCKERLFRAKAAKTLPDRKHLEDDSDLINMRDKPWFAELLKDL